MARSTDNSSAARSELLARVLVAVPAAAIAVALILSGGPIFALALALLGVVCVRELFTMFTSAKPSALAGYIGVLTLIAAALWQGETLLIPVLMALLAFTFLAVALQPGGGGGAGISVTLLAVVWIGLCLAHGVLLRELENGSGLIFAVALGTFLGDTGAYLGGRAFGQRKLAPVISPNKTIEGLLIGFLVCVAVIWSIGLASSTWLGGQRGALLGAVVGLAAPLGDLFESYFKRDAGTKDTGRLFGAHGGALDRLDAVMFAVVAAYWTWQLIA